jgi:hypothetical protein
MNEIDFETFVVVMKPVVVEEAVEIDLIELFSMILLDHFLHHYSIYLNDEILSFVL